ncbi:CopD family protein [Paraburkholderia oxyphila]|uniref:CopD family protein n=1 Tax=Paraburkholderia oxyphila TaxID=614212 RepID=UPI000AC0CA01|nr:CopD family protein [Paraburkholderia oxyphila]
MDPLVTAQIALAAVQNLLFAAAMGLFACGVMQTRSGLIEHGAQRVWRAGLTAALACSALAYLWLQAAVMSGSPLAEAAPAVVAVLTQSHFGVAWSVGFAGALLAALGGGFGRRGSPVFAAGLFLWVAGKAAASHAADAGDFSWREANHVVHLLATALWAGSVIAAAVLLKGRLRGSDVSPEQRTAFCSALSHLATSALVVVLGTGFYNVLQDTAHAGAPLLDMNWGRLLAAKLTCVMAAILLGGWNRLVVLPDLRARAHRDDPDYHVVQHRFNRALVMEAAVMFAVLTLAAVLGHTAPTAGAG